MIDWTRVSDLRSEIGDDGFAEVVGLFLEEADEVIDRLTRAPRTLDLGSDMHFLKGSALNLGFCDLAALCENAERLAARGQVELIELTPVLECYENSKIAFSKGLDRQSAA
jgi:histidine phosphotransfer protein HptB